MAHGSSTGVRLFGTKVVNEHEHGATRKHSVIQCSHCPTEATAVNSSGKGGLGDEMLTRKFTRTGWYVGRTPGSHLCPDCNPTKQRAILTVVKADPLPTPEKEEITVSKPAPSAARELSFSDRRIINAKLEEVYENELIGYRTGWDDEKVARDLGVEIAWVAELRTQNFGPSAGSEAMVTLLNDFEQARSQLEQLEAAARAARKALDQFETSLLGAGISVPARAA